MLKTYFVLKAYFPTFVSLLDSIFGLKPEVASELPLPCSNEEVVKAAVKDAKASIENGLSALLAKGVASGREIAEALGLPQPRSHRTIGFALRQLSYYGISWQRTDNPKRFRLSGAIVG